MDAAPLAFWFDAIVVAVVTESASTAPPVEQEQVRAGLELPGSGLLLGPFTFDRFRSVTVEKEITVSMQGTAIAPRFDGIRYVGPPTIESLEVHRPNTLSEALDPTLENPFTT